MPLAIELAASRAAMMAPRQILQHLDRCLLQMEARDPTAPARQRTLRGAIDWTYRLLTLEEQRLFAALGIFAGGFTLEDIEAVCESGDLFSEAERLVQHSL